MNIVTVSTYNQFTTSLNIPPNNKIYFPLFFSLPPGPCSAIILIFPSFQFFPFSHFHIVDEIHHERQLIILFIDLDWRRTDWTNEEVQRSGGGNSCIFVSELLICLAMGEEGFI